MGGESLFHLRTKRCQLVLPLEQRGVDAGEGKVKTRLRVAGIEVDLVRCNAKIPFAVFTVHADPGFVSVVPVVGLEALGGGVEIVGKRGLAGIEERSRRVKSFCHGPHAVTVDVCVGNCQQLLAHATNH